MEKERPKETKVIKTNYAGNSFTEREKEEKAAKKKVDKVVTGEVKTRKKSLGKKLKETFTGDDAHSVGSYIFFDVILPSTKNMIADSLSQGVERLLFGDSRPSARRGSAPRQSYTSYSRYSSSSVPRDSIRREHRDLSRRARNTHEFDEIILETRVEAEEVIDQLGTLISDYDVATVSDLYDLIGTTGSFMDDKWGWTDLRGSGVTRVREGYVLNLPRTIPLD